MDIEKVISAIGTLRVGKIIEEYDLQNKIAEAFDIGGIGYKKEFRLGTGNRVDFITCDGIAIEVKKGKPNRYRVEYQINRYAEFEEVKAIIIVVETSLRFPITRSYNGKPCFVIGLQKLWGIAL